MKSSNRWMRLLVWLLLLPVLPVLGVNAGSGGGTGGGGDDGGEGGDGDGDGDGGDGGGGGGDDGSGGDGGEPRTFTQDEVNRIVEGRLKRATSKFDDYDELKKAAEELQKLKDSELSEKDRLEKKIVEMEQAKADAVAAAEARAMEVNEKLIRAEVRVVAATMGFVSPEDAYRLADLADVSVDDDGSVKGVEKALKVLKKDKAYLLSGDNGQGGVGTPPRGGKRSSPKGEPVPVKVNF